jgi:hypothetical protein
MQTLETALREYESARELLGTLEDALEPMAEDMEGSQELDFQTQYRELMQHFICSIVGADGQRREEDQEAYEELFGDPLPTADIAQFQADMHFDRARQTVLEFANWASEFEEKIVQLVPDSELDGMAEGLINTFEIVGEVFAPPQNEGRRERLDSMLEACREEIED